MRRRRGPEGWSGRSRRPKRGQANWRPAWKSEKTTPTPAEDWRMTKADEDDEDDDRLRRRKIRKRPRWRKWRRRRRKRRRRMMTRRKKKTMKSC